MRVLRGIAVVVLLAFGPAALASAPCNLFQVRMSPPTGSTNVAAPVTVTVESLPLADSDFIVEDETGHAVHVPVERVDAGSWSSTTVFRLADFPGPGWYALRVAVPHAKHESSDRSMLPTHVGPWGGHDEFRGDVLVGRSSPAIRTLMACVHRAGTSWVSVAYSEPVAFPDASIPNVEFHDVQGTPLACSESVFLQPDGGLGSQATFSCDGGVRSLIVRAPPVGRTGVAAALPHVDTTWDVGPLAPPTPPATETCANVLTDVRSGSLADHTPGGLGATYDKCDVKYPRCGCGPGTGGGVVAFLLVALGLGRRRR